MVKLAWSVALLVISDASTAYNNFRFTELRLQTLLDTNYANWSYLSESL